MKILVTGASGFVGRHLLQSLENDPAVSEVQILIREPAAWQAMDWTAGLQKVRLLQGELDNASDWMQAPALRGLTGLVHLAAVVHHDHRHDAETQRLNVDGTLSMLRVAAHHDARMVYMSTSGTVACFSDPDSTADENSPFALHQAGRWPYYASKMQAETQGRALATELGVDFVILRPPIMLGPGDHRLRSTGLLLKFLRRKMPGIIRGGFPYVDVRDVADAMVKCLHASNLQPIYHLPGEECSIDELFSMLEGMSGVPSPKLHLPAGLLRVIGQLDVAAGMLIRKEPLGLVPDPVVIEMGSSYWGMKSLYAKADLDFSPRPGEQTLRDTVDWLYENVPDLIGTRAQLSAPSQA